MFHTQDSFHMYFQVHIENKRSVLEPGVVFPSFIKRHKNHQQSAGLQGFHWLQHFTDQKKQTPTDRPREKSPFRQVLFFGSAEQNVRQFLMMIYEIGQGRPLIHRHPQKTQHLLKKEEPWWSHGWPISSSLEGIDVELRISNIESLGTTLKVLKHIFSYM